MNIFQVNKSDLLSLFVTDLQGVYCFFMIDGGALSYFLKHIFSKFVKKCNEIAKKLWSNFSCCIFLKQENFFKSTV